MENVILLLVLACPIAMMGMMLWMVWSMRRRGPK
jgi:hypothetical protein